MTSWRYPFQFSPIKISIQCPMFPLILFPIFPFIGPKVPSSFCLCRLIDFFHCDEEPLDFKLFFSWCGKVINEWPGLN